VVFNLGDRRKRYFDYLTVCAFYLDAGSCEGLSGFHAANNAPHALSIHRYNLNVVFAVERPQGSECFSDFQVIPPKSIASVTNELKQCFKDIAPKVDGCLPGLSRTIDRSN
jgi:hypothetical protein